MNHTDVLKVDRVLVDGRIYRLLPRKESSNINVDSKASEILNFDEDDVDPDVPIIHQGDRFIATIYVPAPLIGFIVGSNHKNITALTEQYGAKINIPSKKNIEAGITITGSTKRIVSSTYNSIQNKLLIARMRTDSTHFISFPINSSNIQESFVKFKDEILKKYKGVRGIDPSIFQTPARLHVTVTVLVLLDERDKQNAVAILNNCSNYFLKEFAEKEIIVQVKGLEIMNDDPSEVDVLYAKLYELDGDNRLQILANKIMRDFDDAALSRDQHEQVKLHVTLMNTLFRDQLESDDGGERITFDAQKIMKEFENYDFGQLSISEIHISIRYTKAADGYYNCIHKIKLNS